MEGGVQSSNTGRFICVKLRWNFGASGGWGIKGLVKVVGYTVGTGHGTGGHWNSKAVRIVPEAIEGRISTVQDSKFSKGGVSS